MSNNALTAHAAPATSRTIDEIRDQFPALASPIAFLDNAGGSQVPRVVADRIRDYFLTNYVQLGADYATSQQCSQIVADAHRLILSLFGGEGVGEVVLGASSSALLSMLALCYAQAGASDRNEIIISQSNHESNIGPWLRLADHGFTIRFWNIDPEQMTTPIQSLRNMLSKRTRLVIAPHVTNIFGAIEDVQTVCRLAREVGAQSVIDSVAYAPHRSIDVKEIGADWCVYSTYKVYGPHMAALFGAHDALAQLDGPNHFFVPQQQIPGKFELGGVSHEGCAGVLALWQYLAWLIGKDPQSTPNRADLVCAFNTMQALEQPVQERLVNALRDRKQLRIIGPTDLDAQRAPTISFVAPGRSSKEITQRLNQQGLGVRFGHFYSHRLCDAIGVDPADGVIRASLVHYNTIDEVDRLIAALDKELA